MFKLCLNVVQVLANLVVVSVVVSVVVVFSGHITVCTVNASARSITRSTTRLAHFAAQRVRAASEPAPMAGERGRHVPSTKRPPDDQSAVSRLSVDAWRVP